MSQLILVANPGSASRKYAVFEGTTERARLHFEWENDIIIFTLDTDGKRDKAATTLRAMDGIARVLPSLLRDHQILRQGETLDYIGLRVVAPGSYFLQDRLADESFLRHLETARQYAPLHVNASLAEYHALKTHFHKVPIYGISDSAFHATKPDYAWNYGISLELADQLDIKRFGYHGLSVSSVLKQISLPAKTIVCHLGSGASITAVQKGLSKDTTMGYSPLDGVIMNTRSGAIDIGAANRLKKELKLDDEAFEKYLNTQSGLLGLGGVADIRQLLANEKAGEDRARLALDTYIYSLQKSIGQIAAALHGAHALVFTGTAGERSAPLRTRIISGLGYLGFSLNATDNEHTTTSETVAAIHEETSKPIYVVPSREEQEIAAHVAQVAKSHLSQ